ncbi:hypothetical protein GJW-30_1_04026 [Variibacter gotjawalensis]|uniref:N-acetyltransferase domain-containing protein n=1 Tax=Variibacter gotjawalensis TaxID=1333996 RepID=A0A0S3PZY2_9BRAD|nr:hypothetical protein [Variibacter gotjawalensis]NIK47309.1 hypothetical protein [Variibacter gotjawalensis]RZS49207.1 hypothetical protein EV661_1633 [Variibacter gotjawalensis]BAT61469.1 hypothetical protein GJW-30_1_04026 [Variibacter gotjawalensis]
MGFNVPLSVLDQSQEKAAGHNGYHELSHVDAETLLDHYLALNPDQRRARFGAMKSAASLSDFVSQRDWNGSWALGYSRNGLLHGVVELYPVYPGDWRRAEITLTSLAMRGGDRLRNELLQLALFEAGARGTEELIVHVVVPEPWVRSLCAGRATSRNEDQISVLIADCPVD